MSKRALCLLCGTDLKDGKPVIVDDLLKLVENWRVYQANFCDKSNYDEYIYNRGRTYGVCADMIEKLIEGE